METTKHKQNTIYKGHIVDVIKREIFDGEIHVSKGVISHIEHCANTTADAPYFLPGFIDSHVHIESSMMLPTEFAQIVEEFGTIGVVADPHEIANVLGVDGVDFMIRMSRKTDFNFCFGAPSCVPSCNRDIETSGAVLTSQEIDELMERHDISLLSEMMNFPGVLNNDEEVMKKINSALQHGKPVDGHAPGLTGEARRRYAAAGISTDHECSTLEEGRECLECGMNLLIREGAAARNYEALIPLIKEYPNRVMFCTDDSHAVKGHINTIVFKALKEGYDLWSVLQAACINPQRHYHLNWGLLQPNDPATFIALDSLQGNAKVIATYIKGTEVFHRNSQLLAIKAQMHSAERQMAMLDEYPNRFVAQPITTDDIQFQLKAGDTAHIITATDGSLITGHDEVSISGNPMDDVRCYPWNEVQKIVVLDRYTENAHPVVGLIRGFGITDGAMAASIAHDCHNIVAIGSSDEYLVQAINRIIEMRGGVIALAGDEQTELALPIAGLMSPLNGHFISYRCHELLGTIHRAGCTMLSPFITMNFMCLPVIPHLKLTDKGLWNTDTWQFIPSHA